MECPDDSWIGAGQDAQDLSLCPAIVFAAAKLHQHLIAVHG